MQTHFNEQRDLLIQNAVTSAKIICEKLDISTERRVRGRKNMSGGNSEDVVLSLRRVITFEKRGERPLDLLKFIQQYRLDYFVPNIVILLIIFQQLQSVSLVVKGASPN